MQKFFGWYVKCRQKSGAQVAVIFGKAANKGFVQVITPNESARADFTDFTINNLFAEFGQNKLSPCGINLNFQTPKLEIRGEIKFGKFTRPRGHVMGPFRFFPFMECRHMVASLRHDISGSLVLNGETLDFNDGIGYIEGDKGTSFPRKYFWAQAHLSPNTHVFASAAIIPYLGMRFRGTIAAVLFNGREYRLATYRGARVKKFDQNHLLIKQGRMALLVENLGSAAQELAAPCDGEMNRTVYESVAAHLLFRFTRKGKTLFDLTSTCAAFEFSEIEG